MLHNLTSRRSTPSERHLLTLILILHSSFVRIMCACLCVCVCVSNSESELSRFAASMTLRPPRFRENQHHQEFLCVMCMRATPSIERAKLFACLIRHLHTAVVFKQFGSNSAGCARERKEKERNNSLCKQSYCCCVMLFLSHCKCTIQCNCNWQPIPYK